MENNKIKVRERNELGLIKDIEYIFNEDGSVNWRGMVKKDFLYINPQNKSKIIKKYNKEYQDLDIEQDKIEDVDLVILLSGLKYLAQLRGFNSVTYNVVSNSLEQCVCVCRVVWIPNYETEGKEMIFESIAGASIDNCVSFGRKYLPEFCENRSFARNIRNFLQISIVSKEELNENTESSNNESNTGPYMVLNDLMKTRKKDLDDIKKKMVTEGCNDAANWNSVTDIPIDKVEELIIRLKKHKTK